MVAFNAFCTDWSNCALPERLVIDFKETVPSRSTRTVAVAVNPIGAPAGAQAGCMYNSDSDMYGYYKVVNVR